jgi:hypothetical protein
MTKAGKERVGVALTCDHRNLAQLHIGLGTIEEERRSRVGPPLLMSHSVEKRRGVEADRVDQPLLKQSRVTYSLNEGHDA